MDGEIRPAPSSFGSVDPAPPEEGSDVSTHRGVLHDVDERLSKRMRAVFSLRNIGGAEAIQALCTAFFDDSALLRHELAYVLGQMQDDLALPTLEERLSDPSEHVMVRHEAAEAMGAIGNQSSRPILERFLSDPNPEVSQSCEVALDLLELCISEHARQVEW